MAFTDRIVEHPNRISLRPVSSATGEVFIGDGVTTTFGFVSTVTSIESVTIDGVETTGFTFANNNITFAAAPEAGAEIIANVISSDVFDLKRAEGIVTQEGTLLNAESLNAEIDSIVADVGPQIRSGKVSITCKAGVTASKAVTFPIPFKSTDTVCVVLIPQSNAPTYYRVSVSGVSATGFTAYVNRTTAGTATLMWIATA